MGAIKQILILWFNHGTREGTSEENAVPPHYTADEASSVVGMFALTSSRNSLAIFGFETYGESGGLRKGEHKENIGAYLQIVMRCLAVLDDTKSHISWILCSDTLHPREEGDVQQQGVYCIFSHNWRDAHGEIRTH